MRVAVLGGTGKLGLGLAVRSVHAGHRVTMGSRDADKATKSALAADSRLRGASNPEAAEACELALIAVPYAGHRLLVESVRPQLENKLVIDATVPIDPKNPLRLWTESGQSATEETQTLLGDRTPVFAAFQTVSYLALRKENDACDVLVAGRRERKEQVLNFIRSLNLHPVDAGPIEVARLLEEVTILLISINKQHKVRDSGLKILGIR